MINDKIDGLHIALLFIIGIFFVFMIYGIFESDKLQSLNHTLEINNVHLKATINTLNKESKQKQILYKENLKRVIKDLNFKIDDSLAETITIEAIKNSENLDPLLTICIAFAESSFRHTIKNDYGAIGLMQIVPRFHQKLLAENGISELSLYHVRENIQIGTTIFKQYLDRYDSVKKAMQKYCGASCEKNSKKYLDKILPNYIYYKLKYKL